MSPAVPSGEGLSWHGIAPGKEEDLNLSRVSLIEERSSYGQSS